MSKLIKLLSLFIFLNEIYGEEVSKPHIIFILFDDLGWNDVSFLGSYDIRTPNIDTLASDGIVLNQYYTDAFGTPSRSALLTGKYPMRLGVQGISISASEDLGIPESERLLPSYLRELDYETYLIGKWNVGKSRQHYLPIHRGFNTFYGFLDGSIDYFTHDLIEKWNGATAFGLNLYNNTQPVEDQSGHVTEIFTDKAIEIIRNHDRTVPLYLQLSHAAPHTGGGLVNLQTPADTIAANSHIAHSARRTYAGMVTGLDKSVGSIVAALSENEMLQSTIIVIVSDNGALTTGALQNFGSNFPLRGVKGTPWEGAIRSPALIWSPILPTKIMNEVFHVTDWLPTLVHAAGGAVKKPIDGVNQWLSLKDGKKSKRKEIVLAVDNLSGWVAFRDGDLKIILGKVDEETSGYYGEELQALRKDPPSYEDMLLDCKVSNVLRDKLGVSIEPESITAKRKELNLSGLHVLQSADICIPTKEKGCLFNISADPLEAHDLWNKLPDIVHYLTLRVRVLWSEMKPRCEPKRDPRADPSLRNYTWAPWIENDEISIEPENKTYPAFPLHLSQKELQYIFKLNVGTFSEKLCKLIKNMGDSFTKTLSSLFNY
ncbi:Arylsulfatase B [Papilio machaon]|uniref:Arylsulfatase B n=1 Tax=Papilio machaon TaxID=76193 RepID=A0A194RQ78_PAPMA|nr:Arylsulfatase B [Papilio machaon]